MRYLSVYNSNGKATLWPGPNLVLWSSVISLYSWEAGKLRCTRTQTHTCAHHTVILLSYSSESLLSKKRERQRETKTESERALRSSDIHYCLLQAQTQYCPHPHQCFLKMKISLDSSPLTQHIHTHTHARARTSHMWWDMLGHCRYLSVRNHSRGAS